MKKERFADNSKLSELLQKFGLSKNASVVACVLFRINNGSATSIAKESGLPRTTVYGSLEELLDRGLVVRIKSGSADVWKIISPNDFNTIINQNRLDFKSYLPELSKSYKLGDQKERDGDNVLIYNGQKDIEVLYGTLLSLKRGEKLYAIEGHTSVKTKLSKFSNRYIVNWQDMLRNKGIVIEAICCKESFDTLLKSNEKILSSHSKRATIIWQVPNSLLDFEADIIIYKDILLQIDHSKNIAVSIRSKELVKAYKALFELLKSRGVKIDLNEHINKVLNLKELK